MGTSWDNDRSVRTPQNGPFRLRSSSLTDREIKAQIGALGFAVLSSTPGAPGDFVKIIELVKFGTRGTQPLPFALLSVAALAPKSLPSTPSRRPACGRAADSPTSCAPSRSSAAW